MSQQQPPWDSQQQPPQDQWGQQPQQPAPPAPQQWNQQPAPPPPGWGAPPTTGWGSPEPAAHGPGTSIWAIVAGVCLLLWGLLWTLGGIIAVGAGGSVNQLPGVPAGVDFGGIFATVGIVILVIGILHLLAAIFIWAHRDWARYLGLVLAVLGTLLGLAALASPRDRSAGEQAGDPIVGALFFLVPYAIALIGLILGGKHFRRGAY
jgi:hypothetical protein